MRVKQWIGWLLLICCLGCVRIAVAQASAAEDLLPRDRRNMLPGKVLAVDPDRQLVRLSLSYRADTADAPGKVPDDMAHKAAELESQANNIELINNAKLEEINRLRLMQQTPKVTARMDAAEKQAKKALENVGRLRKVIQEIMYWRETELTISAADAVAITTRRRVTLDKMSLDDHVSLAARVEGDIADNTLPANVTLMSDIIQRDVKDNASNCKFRHMPGTAGKPGATFTIAEMIGTVASINPLVVKVKTTPITVTAPEQFGYIQFVSLSLQELQPGMPVLARMRHTARGDKVGNLFILPPGSNNPFIPYETPGANGWLTGQPAK